MQFQVPQFVEVEDKIFGPLTATQFIYVVGGVGFAVAMWLLLPLWAAVLVGGPVAGLGLALAFYRINDRPLIVFIEAGFGFLTRTKLYIWEHRPTRAPAQIAAERVNDPAQFIPAATGSRIKDLSWSLDVEENVGKKRGQPL